MLKPLHEGWVVEFYNVMSCQTGRKVIESGWRAAGITDAAFLGSKPPIDPFHDIELYLRVEADDEGDELRVR